MGRRLLIAATMLAQACQPSHTLVVDLRTDLVPTVEFERVETALLGPGSGFEGAAVVARVEHAALADGDYLGGLRIAELDDLEGGPVRLLVSLHPPNDGPAVERPVLVQLEGTASVTVLVTRDCANVRCPAEGGDPDAIACLGGTCVVPGCTADRPEACPEPACASAADCEEPAAACAAAACEAGACVARPNPSACPDGLLCHPVLDCVAPEAPPLALAAPNQLNLGSCAALAAEGGRPPYAFSVVGGEVDLDPATGELCATVHGGDVRARVTDDAGTVAEAPVQLGGDALYYVGGRVGTDNATGYVSDVYRSDDDGATWDRIGELPAARYNASALVWRGAIWVIGGRSSLVDWHDEIYRSTDGVTWEMVGRHRVGRAAAPITVFDGQLVTVGGVAADARHADVSVSADGLTWEARPDFPVINYGGVLAPLDGQLVQLGGERVPQRWWVTEDLQSWTEQTPALPAEVFFTGFAVFRGVAYFVAGAVGPDDRTDTVMVSRDRLATFELGPPIPETRKLGTLLVHRDALLYVGGLSVDVLRSDDGETWVVAGQLPEALNGGAVVSYSPP